MYNRNPDLCSVRFRGGNISNIHYIHVTFHLQRDINILHLQRDINNLIICVSFTTSFSKISLLYTLSLQL